MTTVAVAPFPVFAAQASIGGPLGGGLLYAYLAGTTTPTNTYTDSTGTVANTNPVVLNANGEASVWLDQTISYKLVLTDSNGNTQWTQDHVQTFATYNELYQAIIQGTYTYLTVTGTNTLTGTAPAGLTAFTTGQLFQTIIQNTNTGPVTATINSLPQLNVNINGTALVGGELQAGACVVLMYDGTQLQIVSGMGSYVGQLTSTSVATPGGTCSSGTAGAVTNSGASATVEIVLPPGDFDIWGAVNYLGTSTTSITALNAAISNTSTSLGIPGINNHPIYMAAVVPGANPFTVLTPTLPVHLTASATYFLVQQATFGVAGLTAYGGIYARRRK